MGWKSIRGAGLVVIACKLILRVADKYYRNIKKGMTTQEQQTIEGLFDIAETVLSLLGA